MLEKINEAVKVNDLTQITVDSLKINKIAYVSLVEHTESEIAKLFPLFENYLKMGLMHLKKHNLLKSDPYYTIDRNKLPGLVDLFDKEGIKALMRPMNSHELDVFMNTYSLYDKKHYPLFHNTIDGLY